MWVWACDCFAENDHHVFLGTQKGVYVRVTVEIKIKIEDSVKQS